MKTFLRCLPAFLLFFSTCEYSRAAKIGEVIFREDFQSAATLKT